MSLIVSMRVADGIVIGADSLSISQNLLEFVAQNVEIQCPRCKEKVSGQELRLPPIPIPFSASSYTQKLFSLYDNFAIGSFGQGIINNRSIYYHIRQFEQSGENPGDLDEVRRRLIDYFEKELVAQYPKYKEEAPKEWRPIGLHINGYEEVNGKQIGVTWEIFFGRENIERKRDIIGCTIGGDMKVVLKLWELGKDDPRFRFKYALFSLQDAVDLSEFLIAATSTFQRFANEVQTVGGEIDIALLTPFQGFQWIKRKKLMEVLEKSR